MLVLMKCKCQMQCLTLGCYMQQLARDGYNFYYPMRDQMDSSRLSSVCSKNATSMPPPLCIRWRRHLFGWTPPYMFLANSTNFIEDMSWVHHASKPLMTTTTTDMFFVHQTEAQRYLARHELGWQEWEVSCPVRWMMLGPSSAHEKNGKHYFVNQSVCTNA